MPCKNALIAAAAFLLCTAVEAAETRHYVTPGRTMTVETDGSVVTVEYQEHGGVDIRSVTSLDPNGLPVSVTASGTLGKQKFTDTFERSNKPGFFVSLADTPEQTAMLARALLATPDGTLPLLPYGRAKLVRGGSAVAGKREVGLYAIMGVTQTPLYVWLDEDENLYASITARGAVYRRGEQAHVQKLTDVQNAHLRRWRQNLATHHGRRPANGMLAVTNARLFDPVSGKVTDGTTILVRGNRLVGVGTNVEIPADAERLDAAGKMVVPGLWDMHGHLWEDSGLFHLASGVTSVRDVGSNTTGVIEMRRDIESGARVGPRIFVTGFLNGVGPQQVAVQSAAQVEPVIDAYLKLGVDHLKIYSHLKPELIKPIAAYAHRKGLRLSGHIPAGTIASKAVADGLDEIHHVNQVMLNFMPDVKKTDTELRFTAVGERGGALDLASRPVKQFISLLRDRGTVVDPTVGVFEWMFATPAGAEPPFLKLARERIPAMTIRTSTSNRIVEIDPRQAQRYDQAYRKMLAFVGALHRGGVRIVAGTDGIAGASIHRELELYAEAGLSNVDVLRTATLVPAQVMRRDAELGSVATGKLADFIVVDGDPTRDLSALRKVVTVVKDGRVYDAKALWEAAGL